MKFGVILSLIETFGLTACQNPVRDPIDSVVQVVTDPKKEPQKEIPWYTLC